MKIYFVQGGVFLASLFLTGIGYTQSTYSDEKVSQWQIGLGYGHYRTLDKNASPLIYAANMGILDVGLEKQTASNSIWNIHVQFGIGNNQSNQFGQRKAVIYDPHPITGFRDSIVYLINPGISLLQATLSGAYLWEFQDSKFQVHLGGKLYDQFLYGALGSDVWFFNQLSIAISGRGTIYENQKSKLDVGLDLPVFSYLLRQPYTLDPSLPEENYLNAHLKTGSQWNTLDKFQQVKLEMNYWYKSNGNAKVGLAYQFLWMNDRNYPDRNLKMYTHSISLNYLI